MLFRRALLILVLSVVGLATADAENSVVIESKSVCTGENGVVIGIKLNNDVSVRHLTIPLEIRTEEGDAFISSLKLNWTGRLPVGRGMALSDNVFNLQYRDKDCECTRTKASGFGTTAYSDTLSHPAKASPVGALFSRFRFSGPELAPGRDEDGASILLTMDIGNKAGTFVIDTTCICPSHALMFVYGTHPVDDLIPSFKKGVITVKKCSAK